MNNDLSESLQGQVKSAFESKTPLRISAGGSKLFYGNAVKGDTLDVKEHSGIIEYHPSELVLTARCGTRLSEIEQTLKDNNQMLAFEPPIHTENATFGGAIATGLSGPRRAFSGAARDFVLGTRIINGKGENLKFGGQVMKNVAGYDASRLMTGAQGTLGVLLDISVKVLPLAETESTLSLACDETTAHNHCRDWAQQGHPVTASCFYKDRLFIRLSSTENSVNHAIKSIGGDIHTNDIWASLRNQTHDFFSQENLWRVSLPSAAKPVTGDYPQLTEWSGALRWISANEELFETASKTGGHACRYDLQNKNAQSCFQPLSSTMLKLQQRIKSSFDPASILNPGRIYTTL